METLEELTTEAWAVGKTIDLSGVGYGRVHWGNRQDLYEEPLSYYYFLAGMVKTTQSSRILEIGTHWGGSTRALMHGLAEGSGQIVTVDIMEDGKRELEGVPTIHAIVGDANEMTTIHQVQACFPDGIDLLYIDADHNCLPTVLNYAIYSALLNPKFVIFDDVALQDKMAEAWRCICASVATGKALDVTTLFPDIRPQGTEAGGPVGFGLVDRRGL